MIASQKQKNGTGEHIGTADFLYHWIGGTFLTWLLTAFLAGAQIVIMMILLYMVGMNGQAHTALLIAASITGGATAGYLIGRLQYYLMSRRGRPLYEWVAASTIGGLIGMPATLMTIGLLQHIGADLIFYTLLPLPVFMTILSGFQSLVLRRCTRYAPVWMLASTGGALLYALLQFIWPVAVLLQGILMGGTIYWLMNRMTDNPRYNSQPSERLPVRSQTQAA